MHVDDRHLADAAWRKSRYSGTETNCVEVAPLPGSAGVRDSKDRLGGALVLPRAAWARFARAVAAGRLG